MLLYNSRCFPTEIFRAHINSSLVFAESMILTNVVALSVWRIIHWPCPSLDLQTGLNKSTLCLPPQGQLTAHIGKVRCCSTDVATYHRSSGQLRQGRAGSS
jgi:hypothetical protein